MKWHFCWLVFAIAMLMAVMDVVALAAASTGDGVICMRRTCLFPAFQRRATDSIGGDDMEDEQVDVFGERTRVWELSHPLRVGMPLYPMPGMAFRLTQLFRGLDRGVDENGTEQHFWF